MWTKDVRNTLIHGTYEEWLEIRKKFEMLGYKIYHNGTFGLIYLPDGSEHELKAYSIHIILLQVLAIIEHDIAREINT